MKKNRLLTLSLVLSSLSFVFANEGPSAAEAMFTANNTWMLARM